MTARHAYHTIDYDRTQDWRDRAACLDANPEIFFKTASDRPHSRKRETEAKAFCQVCEVAEACLADALAKDDRFGIRGGLTVEERDALGAAP